MCECFVTIREDDPRHDIWVKVAPDGSIPIKYPVKRQFANYPGKYFYIGDANKLSYKQKQTMIRLITPKFKLNELEVRASLNLGEFLILTDNVTLHTCSMHKLSL